MADPLVLSNRQCINASCGDLPELRVVSNGICGRGRWDVQYELIVERISDGTLWLGVYSVGATERQDSSDWATDVIEFQQVVPVQKTVTVYEPAA